jgi:hypothetical protein
MFSIFEKNNETQKQKDEKQPMNKNNFYSSLILHPAAL